MGNLSSSDKLDASISCDKWRKNTSKIIRALDQKIESFILQNEALEKQIDEQNSRQAVDIYHDFTLEIQSAKHKRRKILKRKNHLEIILQAIDDHHLFLEAYKDMGVLSKGTKIEAKIQVLYMHTSSIIRLKSVFVRVLYR